MSAYVYTCVRACAVAFFTNDTFELVQYDYISHIIVERLMQIATQIYSQEILCSYFCGYRLRCSTVTHGFFILFHLAVVLSASLGNAVLANR